MPEFTDRFLAREPDRPLLVFAPMEEEIDLWPWIKEGWREGRRLYFPLTGADGITFYPAASELELADGYWGIQEPVRRDHVYRSGPALAIVPGLLFDCAGGRIGYGGGYYDRFLREHAQVERVGVSYRFQLSDSPLPQEDWDQRMDYIITEDRIIDCSLYR